MCNRISYICDEKYVGKEEEHSDGTVLHTTTERPTSETQTADGSPCIVRDANASNRGFCADNLLLVDIVGQFIIETNDGAAHKGDEARPARSLESAMST